MKPLESTHILTPNRRSQAATACSGRRCVCPKPSSSILPPKRRPFLRFAKRFRTASPFAIIAEVKKASPSKGVFSADFSVPDLVRTYTEAGASAISVVTEEDFFQGRPGLDRRDPRDVAVAGPAQGLRLRSLSDLRNPGREGQRHSADCGDAAARRTPQFVVTLRRKSGWTRWSKFTMKPNCAKRSRPEPRSSA